MVSRAASRFAARRSLAVVFPSVTAGAGGLDGEAALSLSRAAVLLLILLIAAGEAEVAAAPLALSAARLAALRSLAVDGAPSTAGETVAVDVPVDD